MTFPILGGNGAGAEQYLIDNSVRLNDNDSAHFGRTFGAGDRRTFTFSFWFKRGNLGGNQTIFSNQVDLFRIENDNLKFVFNGASSGYYYFNDVVFRDVSAWYHITLAIDTTDATGADRLKLYVNGERLTPSASSAPSQNYDTNINNAQVQVIGKRQSNGDRYLDGYLSEFVFIDGTALTPTSFAEADEDSGIWKPIDVSGLDYSGVNSFYLDFENSGSLGADVSGNANNWTPSGLASTDQTTDTPTNNFATYNPLFNYGNESFSEGNLNLSTGSSGGSIGTIAVNTGKWYWEIRSGTIPPEATSARHAGVAEIVNAQSSLFTESVYYCANGNKRINNTETSYGASFTAGDILGVALDVDNQTVTYYKNNSSQGSIDISSVYSIGDNVSFSMVQSGGVNNTEIGNFGQDSSFAGNKTRQNNSDDNGFGDFYYAPPSGYLALCTQNLATVLSPTIDDGSQYFNTALYTGTGAIQSITGVGFQPDWVWIKRRDGAYSHYLYDSSRGAGKQIFTNLTIAEATDTDELTSFDSDGFTLGTSPNRGTNENGNTQVAWNWKANAGSTSSNTDGSITSTVQANTTAGFSIVTWSGTGATGTIGHGLGVKPNMIIVKSRSGAYDWAVYHGTQGATKIGKLNLTDAFGSTTAWNSTEPTTSVFSVINSTLVNNGSHTYVAYCFADIEGYSKFGSYTGNGSTDGTFVYTGFRPAWLMIKRTSDTGNWLMYDVKRNTYNVMDKYLLADDSQAEVSTDVFDFTSNGFKIRYAGGIVNTSGSSHIYMCFASNPFVSSTGIPVTAR